MPFVVAFGPWRRRVLAPSPPLAASAAARLLLARRSEAPVVLDASLLPCGEVEVSAALAGLPVSLRAVVRLDLPSPTPSA